MYAVSDFEHRFAEIKPVLAGTFGSSLIIAPHPDDETLGCGGTVALLLQAKIPVSFLFVSDGTMSHPNSKKYPAPRLRTLRESEAKHAVQLLGGHSSEAYFLAFPDRHVPDLDSPYFEAAVRLVIERIGQRRSESIFVPWQNDPHPDHRATYQILQAAVSRMNRKPRLIQYPVWLWEMGSPNDMDLIAQMSLYSVDITQTLDKKMAALWAHQSQITDLIDDDAQGFRLSKEMIAHFSSPREIFFELNPNTHESEKENI
ncbi:PIG-L family deacetylase [Dyadobacter luteus]|jgi:LmbE family N-acetylglucosaminyl deacetylase|uniref:PIG-L family deacetylase n=1 Tax=Dyadobacter luteus TaxID=2259619 RepID=A0A3D8YIT6_9BACT|nr:PIG-L deacetylase family protein [Dyadobacter luteus]REA63660.1 PIG-L family deacetylase [Dyadobacter luteus]